MINEVKTIVPNQGEIMENNNAIINGKSYEIKPVKVKRMRGFYGSYLALKEYGLLKLLNYSDGEENLLIFLKGIFDVPEVNEGLLKGLYEELIDGKSEEIIEKMLEIAKRLNLIEE